MAIGGVGAKVRAGVMLLVLRMEAMLVGGSPANLSFVSLLQVAAVRIVEGTAREAHHHRSLVRGCAARSGAAGVHSVLQTG